MVEASKTSAKFLTDQKAKKIIAQLGVNNSAVVIPEKLIELLKGMQDIEYPDADLLHTAIQNKFVKGLGICQVNKSNTLDINIIRLNEKDQKLLHEELKDIFPFISTRVLTHSLCNESDYEHIRAGYDTYIRPAVEALYREDMPAYKSMDIQWSGKQCGCVPKEMVTLAYGIYPYWSVTKETQNFDFSAFSRVAYRGFTFSDRGQLQQIRADNQAKTLLNSTDGHSAEFIHVARTYSGKVDWMIEKDWSHFAKAQSTEGQSPLTHALETVRGNIVNLLATPLDDPFAPLRPWLSLGFAGKPTNGDRVTLYFRHFP